MRRPAVWFGGRRSPSAAVFVHSDVMVVGVLKALHERGVRVPGGRSVVGCDDLSFAAYLLPPLTTVRVPFQQTGEGAATILLDHIRGQPNPRRDLLPVDLVVRASTAPPGEATGPILIRDFSDSSYVSSTGR